MGSAAPISPNGRSMRFFYFPPLYTDAMQERQMDLIEVFNFLFMLSTMELGRVSL